MIDKEYTIKKCLCEMYEDGWDINDILRSAGYFGLFQLEGGYDIDYDLWLARTIHEYLQDKRLNCDCMKPEDIGIDIWED